MKTISKTLILGGLIFLYSCGKDKDNDTNTNTNPNNNNNLTLEAAIVGNWDQTQMEEKNGTITINGMPYMTYTAKAINDQSTWVFSDNPKEVDVNSSYDFVVNYKMGGVTQPDTTSVAQNSSLTYILTGNDKITISDMTSGESAEFDVLSFSNNKLELFNHTSYTDSTTGMTMTSATDVYITLEK